ncbi:hypothetical protein [Leptothrix ochracea]
MDKRLRVTMVGSSCAWWLSNATAETYTAHATAIPAVQSNKVYPVP